MIEINETIARKVLETVDAGLSNGLGSPTPGNMCVEAAVCYALGLPHGDDPQCVSPALRSLKIRLNDSPWSSNTARAAGMRRLAVAQLGSKDMLDDKVFVRRVVELNIRKYVPIALRAVVDLHPDEKHKTALMAAADRCGKEGTHTSARAASYAAARAAADTSYAAAANAADAARAAAYAAADAARAARAAAYAAARAAAYAAARAAAYAAADAARAAANAAADAARAAANAARDKVLAGFAEDVVQILVSMDAPGCQWLSLTV